MTIDTTNRYMVGAKGRQVAIMLPPAMPISRADALNLAAWLAVIAEALPADDDAPDFDAVREAIEEA